MTKRAKAFTLAEVLITLGIIGVVAAITIPAIIQKNYEKQTQAKLKEVYSVLSQAVKLTEDEYGSILNWDIKENSESAQLIAERLKPFLRVAIDCGLEDSAGNCIYNEEYTQKNGNKISLNYATVENYYKMKLHNGISIFFRGGNDSSAIIFVDTNGKTNPNIIGKDTFAFNWEGNGLRAAGSNNINNCYDKSSNGYQCTYDFMTKGVMDYLK